MILLKAGGKGDLYLNFIEQVVVPYVKKTYRVDVQRSNFGILGSSLGGLISCYAGWTRSEIWSIAGCMSSSFWWNNEDFTNSILTKYKPPTNIKFYVDSGDINDDEQQTITVRDHMKQLGYTLNQTLFYYLDHGGQHNEQYWGRRFWIPMTDLYPPSITAISSN